MSKNSVNDNLDDFENQIKIKLDKIEKLRNDFGVDYTNGYINAMKDFHEDIGSIVEPTEQIGRPSAHIVRTNLNKYHTILYLSLKRLTNSN